MFDGSEEERRRILETGAGAAAPSSSTSRPRPRSRRDLIRHARRPAAIVVIAHRSTGRRRTICRRASRRCARPAPKSPSWRSTRRQRSRRCCRCSTLAATNGTSPGQGHVLIAMGAPGWRRACSPRGSATAGPTPATTSRRARSRRRGCCEEFRFRRIAPDAAVYGVVGNPVVHSLSPVDAQRRLRRARPERRLRAARGARRGRLRRASRAAIGLRGASITTPFKVRPDAGRRRGRRRWRGGSARSTRSRRATAGGSATNTDVDGLPRRRCAARISG